MRLLQSFGLAIPLTYQTKALISAVLYGHRFFFIPALFCFMMFASNTLLYLMIIFNETAAKVVQ